MINDTYKQITRLRSTRFKLQPKPILKTLKVGKARNSMESLFSHLVYEIHDIGVRMQLSEEPLHVLVAGFTTEKLAKDFVDYQKTINKKKYKVKIVERLPNN